jgi:hypothetical protein
MSDVAPTVLTLHRNVIGATLHRLLKGEGGAFTAPIGETRQSRSTNWKFLRNFFFIRCASPTGGVRIAIATPIVLAQHKGNKRIGEGETSIRRTSPIVIELPVYLTVLTKMEFVKCETTAN